MNRKSILTRTKHDYKVILKIFCRWLKDGEEYPEEVQWIRARIKNPEEVPTEEVNRLSDVVQTSWTKCSS